MRISKYPGAALLTSIVAYASEFGRRPSDVYDDYLAHPKDYELIFSWRAYLAEVQKEEVKKQRKPFGSDKTGFGR